MLLAQLATRPGGRVPVELHAPDRGTITNDLWEIAGGCAWLSSWGLAMAAISILLGLQIPFG
jgi:hypothetical protein